MEVGIAASEMARHASALGGLANLTLLPPPILRDRTKSFGRFQLFRISEFDFGCPDGTHNVSPVVPCCPLQRFPRTDRLADSFLALTIELDGLGDHLLLQPFLLLVSIGLLATRVLRSLHQIVLSVCHRAKNTFVGGRDGGTAVIRAHIAKPLTARPI
jgi:hypothetical protein